MSLLTAPFPFSGAAAFEAQKAYLDHKEMNGAPQDHEMAKQILAGMAGAACDRLIEYVLPFLPASLPYSERR